MKPGIYRGMSAGEYHAIPAVSSSRLRKLPESPAHARLSTPATPTMDLGSLAHVAILEPARFDATYTVALRCEGITGKGEPCSNGGKALIGGLWYCGVHAKGQPDLVQAIDPVDHAACLGMRGNLHAHPAAQSILEDAERELSLVWLDEETGLTCKARLDLYKPGTLADLKTTKSAKLRDFMHDAFRRRYHVQLAMYEAGAKACGLDVTENWILAAEPTAPYPVNAFNLTDAHMNVGRSEYRRLLDLWDICEHSGEWPVESEHYPAKAIELPAPDYAYELVEVA